MIPRATIDEIRDRAPIVDIIARDVKLKRAGREWRGLSPFKAERTPSFFVSDVKRRFFDFAAGIHGSVIDFLMRLHRLSFIEACEFLAGELGMRISGTAASREDEARRSLKAETQAVLDAAQAWFVAQLGKSSEARDYLAGRGLKPEVIAAMGIGYAPQPGALLAEHLAGRSFSDKALAASGLFKEPGFAFLRHRVLFPIRDVRGRVVSFGGRALGPGVPKYINGPETLLFDKGRTLYGFDTAQDAIRRLGRATVVEGYMDVAQAWQAGCTTTVGTMGTTLQLAQAWLLWRQAPDIVACMDGDPAGELASARMLEAVMPAMAGDRRIGFVTLPSGYDPDEFLRHHGGGRFDELLRNRESCIDRLWRQIAGEVTGGPADQAAMARDLIKRRTEDIADESLRASYRDVMLDRIVQLSGRSRRRKTAASSVPGAPLVPGREACLALAVAEHPEYVDMALERLGLLQLASPLAAATLAAALSAAAAGEAPRHAARDLAVLRSSVPQPTPGFVASYSPAGFLAALDVQAEAEQRRRLRSMLRASGR